MTEDDRIAELFRAAASEAGAPPSGFDHRDVVAVSRRITARRRSAVVGGAVALLFVAGVGTVAVLPRSDSSTMTTASAGANADNNAPAAPQAAAAAPEAAAGGADSAGGAAAGGTQSGSGAVGGGAAPGAARSSEALTPGGGGGSKPSAGAQIPGAGTPVRPLGPGSGTCANRQDPALKALVVAVIPEAANAPGAATSDICLPGTQRYLSIELGGGVLTVGYLPPGTSASLAEGASSAATASHGTVTVSPAPGYADRVPMLLQYLAPRL
jgi:hypothetical protein